MGGTLHIESMPNKGSTFFVELNMPFVASFHTNKIEQAKITGFTGAKKKILVVDDKWENRAVLVNFLNPLGFEIEEAQDGQKGVEKAIAFQPDLILMDLVMPNMDGFEATRQIRQHSTLKDVIIIAVSASAFDFHRQESKAVGCNDFVSKPVYADDLFSCLQFHLQLNWVYEQKPTFFTVEDELPIEEIDDYLQKIADTSFTVEQANTLFELAKVGDIQGIIDYTKMLEQSNPELKPFLKKICLLAEGLDDQRICEIIQHYLDNLS
jgi:CheY-like chemotaxis protein